MNQTHLSKQGAKQYLHTTYNNGDITVLKAQQNNKETADNLQNLPLKSLLRNTTYMFVFAWCLSCLNRHGSYGKINGKETRVPTMSSTNLFFENDL